MATTNLALEQFIRSIPLFSFVEPKEMLDLIDILHPVQLVADQVLFREGSKGDAVWILGEGCEVAISVGGGQSNRAVVAARAFAGSTVGEMALIDDGRRSATAVVVREGPAHQILATDFQRLRADYCPAAFKVVRRMCMDLCAHLRATRDRIAPSNQSQGQRLSPGETEVTLSRPLPGRRPDVDLLDQFGPLKSLPKVVKLALAQKLQLVEVPEDTTLFAEGETAEAAFFIVSGEVTVGRSGRTFANLGAGEMFGLVSAFDSGRRSATARSTRPSRLLRLSDSSFDSLLASGHRFAFAILDVAARQLVGHLRQLNRQLGLPARVADPQPMLLELDLELELELDASVLDGGEFLTS